MSHAVGRAPTAISPHQPLAATRGPKIWAVAWRVHRAQNLALAGLVLATLAGIAALRYRIVSVYTELGCALPGTDPNDYCADETGSSVWWNYGFSDWWGFAHGAVLLGAVFVGAFAAAPVFTREFTHGTHVFALSQSVGKGHWFFAKVIVTAVPVAAGMTAVGFAIQWLDKTATETAFRALDDVILFTRGPLPAVTALAAFGLAIAVGMVLRSTIGTIVVALVAGVLLMVGVMNLAPHLLPAERTVTPLAEQYAPMTEAEYQAQFEPQDPAEADVDYDAMQVAWGYLGADGRKVAGASMTMATCWDDALREATIANGGSVTTYPDGSIMSAGPDDGDAATALAIENERNAAVLACATEHGIVASYSDMLPGSMLWPLRAVAGGLILLGAGLFLGLARWRLRRAVARR